MKPALSSGDRHFRNETAVIFRRPPFPSRNRGYLQETAVSATKPWLSSGNAGFRHETVVIFRKPPFPSRNRGYLQETADFPNLPLNSPFEPASSRFHRREGRFRCG